LVFLAPTGALFFEGAVNGKRETMAVSVNARLRHLSLGALGAIQICGNNRKGESTMTSKPTHEQAQLHLQIYEERREPRLRQARDWFFANCFADTLDEAMRIAPPGTEAGTNFMMVISYWDQACALLNYGLLHEDLFFETSGEFFGVWDRIKPTIQEGRKRFSNKLFAAHIEKAANRFETWAEHHSPGLIASMRQMNQQMRSQTKKAA